MKILFLIRSQEYFHYYRTIIESLCERGHTVELLFDQGWSKGANQTPLERACATYPTLSWGWSLRRRGIWRHILFTAREVRTYRRYLLITGQSTYYRDRWVKYLPWFLRGAIRYIPGINTILASGITEKILRFIENTTRPVSTVVADVQKRMPDIIVATPLNQRFAEELEYVKAAHVLGIRSAGSVLSWDNLTTKGLIHVVPDMLLVWNETQVKEASEHHGISSERTRIIGAPVFDQWFGELQPSVSREEFCKKHGINPHKPYILYLGSSRNISGDEGWAVRNVRKALDNSTDPRIAELQIIVRPHGANYKTYEGIEEKGIVVVPKVGTLPSTEESLQLSFNSMYFALAVININTSAMIESMIIGKPVFAMMIEKYHKTQLEAQHFRQLLDAHALILVHNDEELRASLVKVLNGEDPTKEERKKFIRSFIRPNGLEKSAGLCAAEILEKINKTP